MPGDRNDKWLEKAIIFMELTSELGINFQNIWREVVGWVIIKDSPKDLLEFLWH